MSPVTLEQVVRSARPLESQLNAPLVLWAEPFPDGQQELVNRMFKRYGLRSPVWRTDQTEVDPIGRLVGTALDEVGVGVGRTYQTTRSVEVASSDGLGRFEERTVMTRVTGDDGVETNVYITGRPTANAGPTGILFVGAPGMPVGLHHSWLNRLADRAVTVTWETRGLFGHLSGPTPDPAFERHLDDALATVEAAGFERYELIGLCGGAPLALELAARDDRVGRVSLWFGDLDVGDPTIKTAHQRDLIGLMSMADNPSSLAMIHSTLLGVMGGHEEPALAPLTVYPFATQELLRRYCQINLNIMTRNILPVLERVNNEVLLVSSGTDSTVGSKAVQVIADRLGIEVYSVETTGHLDAFTRGVNWADESLEFHFGVHL